MRSVDTTMHGYIDVQTYAEKYGVRPQLAVKLASQGRLKCIRTGQQQQGAEIFVEDVDRAQARYPDEKRPGMKRCGGCMAWLPLSAYSPATRTRQGGQCNTCSYLHNRKREGKLPPGELEVHYRSREAEIGKLVLNEQQLAEREARIAAHAARVAADGQAGNGVKWID